MRVRDVTESNIEADVAIIGSGFGGSLTALLCQKIGLSPVLIERGTHPRFAIGESSTPLADLILADLAKRYDLPRLAPLTKYGTWRRTYPEITCGLKRGFSYFHHQEGELFTPRADHANEMLVAASPSDELSDTQWYRAEFDQFFVKEVQAAGVPYLDKTDIEEIREGDTIRITAMRDGKPIEIAARFVVDASGAGGALRNALGLAGDPSVLRTNSRTVYGHFENVHPWSELHGATHDHPFRCDDAALHHVYDGGWMWVLRFENGITSAGFVVDAARELLATDWESSSAGDIWSGMLRRFPSIARQFEDAAVVQPLVKTTIDVGTPDSKTGTPIRQQRVCSKFVGSNWAMLPFTAGFVDPLHSPGNAFTLLGIERLVRILSQPQGDRAPMLAEYERALLRDVGVVDTIIHGCSVAFAHFELMSTFAMFYFAGAHTSEQRRRSGIARPDDGFLLSHDEDFVAAVTKAYARVCTLATSQHVATEEIEAFREEVAELIEPYNLAGLCDPAKRNMYGCL